MAQYNIGISMGLLTETLRNDSKKAEGMFDSLRGRLSSSLSNIGKTGVGMGAAIGAGAAVATAALETMVAMMGSVADRTLVLSDLFADIQKTSGLSSAEVERMAISLGKIDTRTSLEGLLEIGKVGGQLGIAGAQLEEFIVSTDRAVVALGDEFGGSVEEVTKVLGGLGKLFQETKSLSPAEQLERIGSAMNALGAAGSATSPVMGEFASRIGQLGGLAPSIQNTLGLGAVLQELGFSAEIAAGGLSNILLKAGEETVAFARQLGIGVDAFEKLLDTNPNEVILRLADSFKGLSNTQVISALDSMKVGTQESIKVMSALSGAVEMVREKQKLSNAEFEKATSLYDEFNIKNNTLAGNIEKIQKGIGLMALGLTQSGGSLSFMREEFERWVSKVATWFSQPVSQKLEGERIALRSMGLELQSANTSAERRNELMDILSKKYPEHFKNLGKEKASFDEIEKAITMSNEALVNKIILQKQSEKIQEKQALREEAIGKQVEAEEALRRKMIQVQERYKNQGLNWQMDGSKSLLDNLKALQSEFDKLFKVNQNYYDVLGDGSSRGALFGESMLNVKRELSELGGELIAANGYVGIHTRAVEGLGKEYDTLREKFKVDLGLDSPADNPPAPDIIPPTPTITAPTSTPTGKGKLAQKIVQAQAVDNAAKIQKSLITSYLLQLNENMKRGWQFGEIKEKIEQEVKDPLQRALAESTKWENMGLDLRNENDWVKAYLVNAGLTPENVERMAVEVQSFAGAIESLTEESIMQLSDSVGAMFDKSILPEDRQKLFLMAIGDFLAGGLQKLGGMLIAAGIAMKGLQKSLAALFTNPATAIAAGAVMVATGAVLRAAIQNERRDMAKRAKNVPAFFNGGIVTGSHDGMLAQVGERNQSEAIIPLHRLHEFTGGGQVVRVEGEFSLGLNELRASIEKIDRRKRS